MTSTVKWITWFYKLPSWDTSVGFYRRSHDLPSTKEEPTRLATLLFVSIICLSIWRELVDLFYSHHREWVSYGSGDPVGGSWAWAFFPMALHIDWGSMCSSLPRENLVYISCGSIITNSIPFASQKWAHPTDRPLLGGTLPAGAGGMVSGLLSTEIPGSVGKGCWIQSALDL